MVLLCLKLISISIHDAAHVGNSAEVKKLLNMGVDVNARDAYGGTALHAAMFQNNMNIVKELLEYGFDVNAQGNSNGYTPLHDAVWANNLKAVQLLLEYDADVNIKNGDGFTALEMANKEAKRDIAKVIKTSMNTKNYDRNAKRYYSENDVKAFVYGWFAGFDHQVDADTFINHLDENDIDILYPDFKVNSIDDFLRWYQGVQDSIQWNSHEISRVKVWGSESAGFNVSLDVHWQAKSYNNEEFDLVVHQDWEVSVNKDRIFIINKLIAEVK
jgi:ankyrin repeat protein